MKKINSVYTAMTTLSMLFFISPSQAHLSKQLDDTFKGSMTYLKNTQIRNRLGQGDCRYDFSGGDGCSGKKINIEGEWANFIYPLVTNSARNRSEKGIVIQDSNMFVTSAIIYPLYWVSDSNGSVEKMRSHALKSIRKYKRGEAYSFWPQYTSRRSGERIIGPVNFRVDDRDTTDSLVGKMASNILGAFMPWVKEWMTVLLDGENNPDGFASFLNVPNDADDTSMAMAIETIQAKKEGKSLNLSALKHITKFTDTNRTKHDKRDTWTEKNTGAYLTWLKDEHAPLFGDYESGVVPMGVNNVDCVVNANVVFALSLNDMKNATGYNDSVNYLAKMINSRQWIKGCALYYPQVYTFAYSVTRAYRDGGARGPVLSKAMDQLMKDLIALQSKENGNWCSHPDRTCDYATAMAVTSLINLGEKRAKRLGILSAYSQSITKGIEHIQNAKTNVSMKVNNVSVNSVSWKGGLFFAAEDYRLGIWRSRALTNAIVVEALAKIGLGYHKSDKSMLDFNRRYKTQI